MASLASPGETTSLNFSSLPVKILQKISSHLRNAPIPCYEYRILSRTHLDRPETLRALSATCRRLRTVFLAHAWEHLEICASRKVSDGYIYMGHHFQRGSGFALWSSELAIDFAQEISRKMDIVTLRRPELAAYVQTVTVVLAGHGIPRFVQGLALLPNVRTVQVLWSKTTQDRTLSKALEPHTFYGIRTLVLHSQAFDLVASCPNVEQLTVYARWTRIPLLEDLPEYAPNLRVFTCMPLDARLVQDLVALLPNLAEIPPISTTVLTLDILDLLKEMKNLRRIDLVAEYPRPPTGEPLLATKELIAAAKEILKGGTVRLYGKLEYPGGQSEMEGSSRLVLWSSF